MAFPIVISQNSVNDVTGTSHTVNLPSAIVKGNMLVVFFGATAGGTIGVPAGWNLLPQDAQGSNPQNFVLAWKVADGTDGATTTFTTSNSVGTASFSYQLHGVSGSPEIGIEAQGTNTNNPNPPALSPSWGAKDTLWFAFAICSTPDPFTAAPANYTNFRHGTGGTTFAIAAAQRALNAATEDPDPFTMSSSVNNGAQTYAFRPLPDLSPDRNGDLILGLTQDSHTFVVHGGVYGLTVISNLPSGLSLVLQTLAADGVSFVSVSSTFVHNNGYATLSLFPGVYKFSVTGSAGTSESFDVSIRKIPGA